MLPSQIPFLSIPSSGPVLHFAHANGYPPEVYLPLLERLSEHFNIMAMRTRPLWNDSNPQDISDWKPFADDLSDFLDTHSLQTVIGTGHSFGATTTLRLALRQPHRFFALVLIDPVIFPPYVIAQWKLIHFLKLSSRMSSLARAARRRKVIFQDKTSMFENYRQKTVFNRISDDNLQIFIDGLVKSRPDGQVELVYHPAWEERIYITGLLADMEIWNALATLHPPLLIIRGEDTDTFWEKTARRMQHLLPQAKLIDIPNSSHLVPLERPQEVANVMEQFLLPLILR